MPSNRLLSNEPTQQSPAQGFVDITPADQDLTKPIRGFRFAGVSGATIVVTGLDGSTGTFKNVQQGEYIDGWMKQIRSTGTSGVQPGDIVGYL